MSYIGNSPITQAFLTDTFSGNGVATAFTLTIAPATSSSILVAVSGVLQEPSTYGVAGTTLTFTGAPPSGTNNISVRYLGIPSTGVTTTAYRTLTEVTATANQTSFTIPNYTVGYLDVYQNGVLLGASDYTATNGVNVVLATGATSGDLLTMESFYVSSVIDAIPQTGGTFSGAVEFAGGIVNGANVTGAAKTSAGLYSTGAYAGTYTDGIVADYITGEGRLSVGSNDIVTIYTGGLANTKMASFSNTTTNLASQTGGLIIPTGNTAQRSFAAVNGSIRYNTDTNSLEAYLNSNWTIVKSGPYTATYLLVAGGGGGGWYTNAGGGGGAGGMVQTTALFTPGTTYTITLGAGGAAATTSAVAANNGSNTVLVGINTAIGGGGGGSGYTNGVAPGQAGGSGGGGWSIDTGVATPSAGGAGTSGQGYAGATGTQPGGFGQGGGGGGAGQIAPSSGGGGGNGAVSTITGASVYYAGGGGGAGDTRGSGTAGPGGAGGGGRGSFGTGTPSIAGTPYTGGGGGGGGYPSATPSAGGSGVAIISVPTSLYTGSYSGSNVVVTTSGSNTIVSFYSSGSYTA